MTRIARTLLIVAAVALLAAPAFAFDFGGTLRNSTGYGDDGSGADFTQADSLSAWFQAPLFGTGRFYVQGSYAFTLDRPYLFDLDLAYLQGKATDVPGGPSEITSQLGRINISDMTGDILNGRIDGASLLFGYPGATFRFAAGYTGLFQKPTTTYIMSRADAADAGSTVVVFAPQRLVGLFALGFPGFLVGQDLTFNVVFQNDLRPDSTLIPEGQTSQDPTSDGHVDTQYIGAQLAGSITPNIYYNFYSYLNTGSALGYITAAGAYQYKPILAYAGGLGVTIYPGFLASRIGVRGVFSTGDADAVSYLGGNTADLSTTFLPITQSSYALLFSPQLGNSARAEINFSMKPFSASATSVLAQLQTEVRALGYFRPIASAPVSETGLSPSGTSPYLGSEIDGAIRFRPFSDLGLALSGGVFLPNTSGAFPASEPTRFTVQLEAALTY